MQVKTHSTVRPPNLLCTPTVTLKLVLQRFILKRGGRGGRADGPMAGDNPTSDQRQPPLSAPQYDVVRRKCGSDPNRGRHPDF